MYTIFIGNCAGATKTDLENEFRDFGKILHIAVHKTYAFVDFESRQAAEEAVHQKHHSLFRGRPLTVEHSAGGKGGGAGGKKGGSSSGGAPPPPRDFRAGPSRHRDDFRDEGPVRGFSPPPRGGLGEGGPGGVGRHDFGVEARLREMAERERLIELEQQIMLKEQRAQEMLLAQELEKRKFEMMEMERTQSQAMASSGVGGGGPSRLRGLSPSGHTLSPRPHASHRFPEEFSPPPAKQRKASSPVRMGNIDLDLYRNMVDCCIIYVDKQLRGYAESVQKVLISGGLQAEVQFISRDESLAGTLDNLSQKGIISAVIVDELNEQRKSANVHFLHGTPRGEIQTGIAELPHWLRMHEEYNKFLILSTKRRTSLREMLAELCGEGGGSSSSGMTSSHVNGERDRDRDRDRDRERQSMGPPPPPPVHSTSNDYMPKKELPPQQPSTRSFAR